MKFINAGVVCSVMVGVLLSSCSSVAPVVETQKSATEEAVAPLTPMQTKVQALQGKPNLYKTQASEHKFNSQALSQFQAGLLLKQQGKFAQAKALFMTLSEQHPNLSGIWLQLALLIEAQQQGEIEQRHKDMLRYLNNAIAANPLNYLAHNELAQVLRQQGQFQDALSHYELAIQSWPAFAQGYLNRGILYDLYIGKKSLALADYELYQALTHDNSRQLKGWIIDLQRQIKRAQAVPQAGTM